MTITVQAKIKADARPAATTGTQATAPAQNQSTTTQSTTTQSMSGCVSLNA